MKRCKAEYLFKELILLKSLICKGLPSKDYQDYQRKCLPCIHYMHLDGYFSVIWNHALMVIHYCRESQSCSITQFNNSNPTPDNSTQITIALGTYTYLHVDWPA